MTRLSVLYVDDDRSNLLAMQYALGDALDLRIAESGARALELAEGVDVLVADQRMPGMSGVEVCRRFRELHPHATRILYTAYADAQAGVAAINEGGVARVLIKPVLNEDLLAAILQSWSESNRASTERLESIATSAETRAQLAIEQSLGRSMSPLMQALYDHAEDRAAELALRSRVVSLQAGGTMFPVALHDLAITGIPVVGEACAAVDLDSLLHALILLEPAQIELEHDAAMVRMVLRANDSVARDTMRVASAVLERGGAHVVARDGDLFSTLHPVSEPSKQAVPRLRTPTVDVLIVGEHAAYPGGFGDLSVGWTDAEGARGRVHDARVIVVDERRHDSSLCRELRALGARSLVLRAGELDFARHRTLAGVIDRLIHDGQSHADRDALLSECVEHARRTDAQRHARLKRVRDSVAPMLTHARELGARLRSESEALLTSDALREAWRSCEDRAWPST